MKKMLTLLLTLFALYFGIQFVFNYFSKGHDISYVINTDKGDINVREVLSLNGVEQNNYYFEVSYNDKVIPFKLMKDYMHKQKILKNVSFFSNDNYTCASIKVEGDEFSSDIKCLSNIDNVVYFYSSIYGLDSEMDGMIKSSGYMIGNYSDNKNNYKEKDSMIVYNKNFVPKQNILFNAYKGIYLFGDKVTSTIRFVSLFNNDIYNPSIQGTVGKYYIVADYNSEHSFNVIHVINISNGSKSDLKMDYDISFNSFVEGSVDDCLYLVDIDNKRQYEINPSKKEVKIHGTESGGTTIYQDGVWVDANINDVISQRIVFDKVNNTYNGNQYSRVIYVGDQNYGTYYLFVEDTVDYKVYAVYSNSNQINYLFNTTDINRIFYRKGYVYYINDEELKVFGSDFGNKTLLGYKELKFNTKLNFYVY